MPLFKASPSPREVALEAWRRNGRGHAGESFEPWYAMLHDDIVVWMPTGPFRGETRGIAAVRGIYDAIAQAAPRLVYEEPLRVTQSGDTVTIEFDDHGAVAGVAYRNRIAASYDVRGGKIAAYREYFGDIDPAIMRMMNPNWSKPDARTAADMTDAAIRHRTVTVGAVDLHVAELGEGPPVVLIHGFPQHWLMWRSLMRALAANGFRAIAYDQRGMGGSTITPDGYDKRTLAHDLAGLMDALEISAASIVGYDHGGGTALAFAFEHPHRTTRLAVLEYAPPGFGYEYGLQPTRNWQSWQLAFFTQPDVAVQFIMGKERDLLAWYFWHWSANPDAVDQADFESYVRQLQKPGALRGGFSHFAAVFDDTELFKTYAATKIAAPVLAVGGARAAASFVETAMRALATDVEGHIVPDCGHWIADEQPEALASLVLAFLKR
jgi:pimeloyl-ACP methyl ester carboxylesterase/ketosteroid isomerase-like protein